MLDQVASGQSNNSNQADSENLRQFNEQLARVRQRLFERESTVNQRVTRTFEIVDRAMMIESTLQTRMAPGMAASLNFRSEEHTSQLQSLMRISYAVFCLKNKNKNKQH